MKKLLALALTLCLTVCLAAPVTAIESDGPQNGTLPLVVDAIEPLENDGSFVIVNDSVIALDAPIQVVGQTSYVSYWPIVKALYPDATAVWQNDRAQIAAPGLQMEIRPGLPYLVANGRYLYLEQGVRTSGSVLLVPVRVLCAALGANVAWDPIGGNIVITAGSGPIASGDTAYQSDVLYWLSHIINAESGNQPLAGKIAVGNVVLNRVASSRFPNTVYEVIFQRGQFTPVSNGTIRKEPNAESVIAAKLCLDGASTAGNALYFINPRSSPNSWASRNRPYVATIGAHAFYG